jgi:pyridoxamine 5'-phosphate oxidase family protein
MFGRLGVVWQAVRDDGVRRKEATMAFTEDEIAYLKSQFLARIATVGPDGQPDAAPVGYRFDGGYLYVGGFNNPSTRKYRNVQQGHNKVALIVDDVVSMQPYTPRFLRIYGIAEIVEWQPPDEARGGDGPYLRITPTISWSWNLEGKPFTGDHSALSTMRRSVHQPPSDG